MKSSDQYTLDLHFGESSFYITKALGGADRPKDMAQAWLEGDLLRYEALLVEHKRQRPGYTPPTPKMPASVRGRPRAIDWAQVSALRSQGLSMGAIAKELGCGKTQVFRCLSHMTVSGRK